MPVPTFVAVGTHPAHGSDLALTPGLPAGDALNDILVLHWLNKGAAAGATLSLPAGWTSWVRNVDGNNNVTELFWKRAGAAETDPTFTSDLNASGQSMRISAWRGCVTAGDPSDVPPTGQQNASSTTITSPSITTVTADCLIVKFYGSRDDNTIGTYSGTQVQAYTDDVTAGTDHAVACSYYTKASPGASGTDTAVETINGPDVSYGFAVALKSVADTGRVLDEKFEGAGYEESWVEGP